MVVALFVLHTITAAHAAFTQQLAGALEVQVAVVRVYPLHQAVVVALGECTAEQGEQAVTEKHRLQGPVHIALHIDHRR